MLAITIGSAAIADGATSGANTLAAALTTKFLRVIFMFDTPVASTNGARHVPSPNTWQRAATTFTMLGDPGGRNWLKIDGAANETSGLGASKGAARAPSTSAAVCPDPTSSIYG